MKGKNTGKGNMEREIIKRRHTKKKNSIKYTEKGLIKKKINTKEDYIGKIFHKGETIRRENINGEGIQRRDTK